MKNILILAAFLSATVSHAQDRAAVEAKGRAHVNTLASPEFHGRGYVRGGDSLAADYIAAQFKKIGLQPVKKDFFQPFTFNVNSFPDSMRLEVDGKRLEPGKDFLVDPRSGSARGRFEVVHLKPEDLLIPERRAMAMGVVTGRAIHLQWPATTDPDSLRLFAEFEKDLMHYGPVLKKVSGKLTWSVSRVSHPFPLLEVLGDQLTDSTEFVDLAVNNKLRVRHQARNVVGMARGKSRNTIIVGAHYDHLGRMGSDTWFPGANDNASGVAMLLTLAEHFKKNPARYDIVFVAFAGEEAGLAGSDWFVVDRPLDMTSIKLMLNLDILGTGDDGITVVNATQQKGAFDRLVALNSSKNLLPEVKSRGPACNSDHCPFVKRGVPAIFIYTMGGISAYHDVHDKAETLPLTKFPELFTLLREFLSAYK
jgi:aminopeptidase YwaD